MIKINNSKVIGVARGNTNFTKIYKGQDLVFNANSGIATYSNREIIYKTSDNLPIAVKEPYGAKQHIVSNTYDENIGYCRLKFDGVLTEIYKNFFEDCESLIEIVHIPNTVVSIGDFFLCGCTNLTSIDLSPLSNLTSISNEFLRSCKGLTSIDLSPLSNVVSIGDGFLNFCTNLTSIDLSPLSSLTSIGKYFLSFCFSLTSIDLSPLSNLTSISDSFLGSCQMLTSIDLSPLSNVVSIGEYFLSACISLTSIDLSPLSSLTSIGENFLYNCRYLTSIYVHNDMVDYYKEQLPEHASQIKPISELTV